MKRLTFRISAFVFLAAVGLALALGIGQGLGQAAQEKGPADQAQVAAAHAAGGQSGMRFNPDGTRNLLQEMQDQAAAKRAAAGMMRGMTNQQRWEAAIRHADRRAAEARGKAGLDVQPPVKGDVR